MVKFSYVISNIEFEISEFLTRKRISKVVKILINKTFESILIRTFNLNKSR